MHGHGPIPPTPYRAQPLPVPGPAPVVPAPRPPVDSWLPGFPDTEPPAGLPPHGGPLPGGYPHTSTGGSRAFVVAAVAVLGMLFASGVVALGYTVLNQAGFGAPTRPAIVVPVSPAAQSAPQSAPRPDPQSAPRSGPVSVAATGRAPGASPSVDQVFLGAMRQRPAFAATAAVDLYALGGATCAKLDGGQGFVDVIADGGGRNLAPEDMGYLTGVSVMAYCPRHKPMLERLIGRTLPSI